MDDAIVFSDDDDDCIMIEDTTIVTGRCSPEICSTSFSLVDAVKEKSRTRSNAIESNDWLAEGMDELDRIIRQNRENNKKLLTDSQDSHIHVDSGFSNIPSSSTSSRKPEKRKLTDDEKENQRKQKENAKRAREEENKIKAIEKNLKNQEKMQKKEKKEREKETRKVEREISAATNSKCEQYTFCHIGRTVLEMLPGLEAELRALYSERKIENQMKIEKDLGTRIEWRRKCVELKEDEEGRSERFEYICTQNLFAVVVPATTLKDVILSNSLLEFTIEQKNGFQNGRCTMLIVSFGRLDIQKKKLHNVTLEIYEKHRAQIVQVNTVNELAMLTAQYLRSLARREKKRMHGDEGGGHKLQYQGEKGIVIGSRSEIVTDWWSKMLSTIDRLSDAQRRAIVRLIPDPIAAIDKYAKTDYSIALQEISELVAENGRRVGPAIAHRVLTMLTDETGTALVD